MEITEGFLILQEGGAIYKMDPVVINVSGAIIFKMKNYYVKAKHPKVKFS